MIIGRLAMSDRPAHTRSRYAVFPARTGATLFVGCLRNASAAAALDKARDQPIGLVPAGER